MWGALSDERIKNMKKEASKAKQWAAEPLINK
jgi:hypothetical protein